MRLDKRKLAAVALALVCGLALWNMTELHVWWTIRQLAGADPERCEAIAQELAEHAEPAARQLIDALCSSDPAVCANIASGLETVCAEWPIDDPRLHRTLLTLGKRFTALGVEGQRGGLRFAAWVARRPEDAQAALPTPVGRVLADLLAAAHKDAPLRSAGLGLAAGLVGRGPAGQWLPACRDLAISCLADAEVATRRSAVQVLLREPLVQDHEMLVRLVPLLRDIDAQVRRGTLVALGPHREIASDEDILPLLHDDDTEVQHLGELALRSRGLSDRQLQLARLVSDPSPSVRLQVLPALRQSSELDPEVWLRRLSADPAPAVRAAAVRLAAPEASLRDRLEEIVRSDPSATVREIASYYLERANVRRAGFRTGP